MPFAHNLTIRKTTTNNIETNSLFLSKLTEKKIMRKTHSYRNFSQVFLFDEKSKKCCHGTHKQKIQKYTVQNGKDKGNHLVFVIRPDRWQFVTLW